MPAGCNISMLVSLFESRKWLTSLLRLKMKLHTQREEQFFCQLLSCSMVLDNSHGPKQIGSYSLNWRYSQKPQFIALQPMLCFLSLCPLKRGIWLSYNGHVFSGPIIYIYAQLLGVLPFLYRLTLWLFNLNESKEIKLRVFSSLGLLCSFSGTRNRSFWLASGRSRVLFSDSWTRIFSKCAVN